MFNGKDKKILCWNMLNKKKCNYGNKCVFAHNLNEQKIEPLRHKIYSMIKYSNDLSNINLESDPNLYENLLQLTKVCSSCNRGLCPGGYNCRNGAINFKLRICYDDLVYGNCKRPNCHSIHLTERGLTPYNRKKNDEIFINIEELNDDDHIIKDKQLDNLINKNENNPIVEYSNKSNMINYKKIIDSNNENSENNKKPYINYNNKINKKRNELNEISGVLLTEKFFLNHLTNDKNDKYSSDSDSIEEDVDKMIEYLNNDSSDDDNSIFLV